MQTCQHFSHQGNSGEPLPNHRHVAEHRSRPVLRAARFDDRLQQRRAARGRRGGGLRRGGAAAAAARGVAAAAPGRDRAAQPCRAEGRGGGRGGTHRGLRGIAEGSTGSGGSVGTDADGSLERDEGRGKSRCCKCGGRLGVVSCSLQCLKAPLFEATRQHHHSWPKSVHVHLNFCRLRLAVFLSHSLIWFKNLRQMFIV